MKRWWTVVAMGALLAAAGLCLGPGCGGDPAPAGRCCKICTKGCPCGDTCIDCDKKCTEPPGCACRK